MKNQATSFKLPVDSSVGKESACSAGDPGSIPGLGRSPGEGKGYPLQYSGLEKSMDSPWGHKEWYTAERLALSSDGLCHKILSQENKEPCQPCNIYIQQRKI